MNKEKQILEILGEMIEDLGDGGMDTSYGGSNYGPAQEKAKEKILKLFNN